MKNIIFFLSIFFTAIYWRKVVGHYIPKDSTIQKDSVVMAKADTLMPDSSITEEAPLKQKKTLFTTSLQKAILLSMLTTELIV